MLFSKILIPLALSALALGIQVASLPSSSVRISKNGIARESQDVAEDQKLRGIVRNLQDQGKREVTLEYKAADLEVGTTSAAISVELTDTKEEKKNLQEAATATAGASLKEKANESGKKKRDTDVAVQEALEEAKAKWDKEYEKLKAKHASLEKKMEGAQAKWNKKTEALAAKLEKETKLVEKQKEAHNKCTTESKSLTKMYESSEKATKELKNEQGRWKKQVEDLNEVVERMTEEYEGMKLTLEQCKPQKPVFRPFEAYIEVDESDSHFIPAKYIGGKLSTAGSQLVQDGRVTIGGTKFSSKDAYFHMKCTATTSRHHEDHVYVKEAPKRRVTPSPSDSPSTIPSSSPTTKSQKKNGHSKKDCGYKRNLSEQKNSIKRKLQPYDEKTTSITVHGGPQRAICEFNFCVKENCLLMSSSGRVHFGPFRRESPENVPKINGRVVGCDSDEDDRKLKDGKLAVDAAIDVQKLTGDFAQVMGNEAKHMMGGGMCLAYMAGGVRIKTLQLPSQNDKKFQYHIQVNPNLLMLLNLPLNDANVQLSGAHTFYSNSGNT